MDFEKESTGATPVPAWARRSRDAATNVAAALRTPGGITATVALLPATLVTGCANLAAHELYTWQAGVAAAATVLGAGFLGVKGLAHKWSPAATWTFLGTSAVALDLSVAVIGGGWTDVFAWGAFVAASLGGRLAYMHGTSEKRAKIRSEEAKAEAIQAKVTLSTLKAQTEQINAQLKMAQLAKATAPVPEPYRPKLDGFTVEEAALRLAFWDVHKTELLLCEIEPTQTGYTATIGLPGTLPRDQVRTQWDKISTALRAQGRFVLADGRMTNELKVKFLDASMKSTVDVTWNPGLISSDPLRMSIGIDTETGEPVHIYADERTLICGASGTGKSWSARAMMAHAHHHGDVVLLDGKGEEGTVWDSVCRVCIETDDILDMIDELHSEMNERKMIMRKRGESVWSGRQLTAVVDEGQVVIALIASSKKTAAARMQRLRELSSLGRSRGIVLWWATQKPVMSGQAPGIDNLIAPNLLQRFSLRVADEQEARTALDDCAHYGPNLIPDDRSMRGHGYLKGFGPTLIRTWTLDDAAVRSQDVRKWTSTGAASSAGTTDADRLARYFSVHPEASGRAASRELNIPEATVRRLRKTL